MARERSGAAGGRRHARKTAKAPVLMAEAWARTPSIARTGMPRPVCEVARSAAADSPCLGSGRATKTLAHARIRRLSVVAGTARARWMWQLAAVCWAEMLPTATAEADRGLGPMLPSSARELWPFCVLRLPDQPGFTTKWLETPGWWPRVGYRTDQNFEEAICRRTTDERTAAAPNCWHGSQSERCRLGHRVARRPTHC